jgi:hypothetical protein
MARNPTLALSKTVAWLNIDYIKVDNNKKADLPRGWSPEAALWSLNRMHSIVLCEQPRRQKSCAVLGLELRGQGTERVREWPSTVMVYMSNRGPIVQNSVSRSLHRDNSRSDYELKNDRELQLDV